MMTEWLARCRERAIEAAKTADVSLNKSKGGRIALYRAARSVLEFNVDTPTTVALLAEHWAPRCGIGWSKTELQEAAERADEHWSSDHDLLACLDPAPEERVQYLYIDRSPDLSPSTPEVTPSKSRLSVVRFEDVRLAAEGKALVEGLLDQKGFSVVFGEPKAGKSFLILDLCFHIAAGLPWHGRSVVQGIVVYVSLEGGADVLKRLIALRVKYGLTPPLHLISGLLDLSGSGPDVQALLDAIAPLGQPVLIVIDTLSRALSGADENSSQGMAPVIANGDRIRAATGAGLMLIHHVGKDPSKGARGHSSLRGAADSILEVQFDPKTRERKLLVRDQRAMEQAAPIAFGLESVTIGDGEDGPITSCVAVPRALGTSAAFKSDIKPDSVAGRARTVLQDLTLSGEAVPLDDWRAEFIRVHYPTNGDSGERMFRRAVNILRAGEFLLEDKKGHISCSK